MRVSLAKWLLLRWLSEGPATGYELMKLYEQAFGRASPGTIYPLLSQLEAKGLVRKREDGKYYLTDDGVATIKSLEEQRSRMMEIARTRLQALADLFDDPYLRRYADYLPLIEKVPPPVLDALADIEILSFELGERAVPILEEMKKRLERVKANGASSKK